VGGPDELSVYTPDFVSHLIDLHRYNDGDLPQDEITQAALLLMKYIARAELQDRLQKILILLRELLNRPDGLENLRAFLKYITLSSKHVGKEQLKIELENTYGRRGAEIMGTIAEEWVEDGRREGLEKGLEKGRVEGRVEGLRTGVQAVVELRFPQEAALLSKRLESIDSAEQLSEVLMLSRTAETIDELFKFINRR